MPAHFTVNPRTGNIEYIQVQPELLSLTAFRQGVRSTCAKTDGGDVQIVIPAYLDEDHFQRALPLLPSILRVHFLSNLLLSFWYIHQDSTQICRRCFAQNIVHLSRIMLTPILPLHL